MSYCLNPETKEHIVEAIQSSHIVKDKANGLIEFIEGLDKCSTDDVQKGRKNKRPLSQYNIFLSSCMKKDIDMKSCIPHWRNIKECIKNNGSLESCKAKEGY